MRYTLRQLEVFIAVLHYENISKAAQSLAMSQSAASTALKELESQFDIKLFDRVGKRLQINTLGKQLRPEAERLMEQAKAFEQSLQQKNQQERLQIGATLSIGNYLLINMLAAFSKQQGRADDFSIHVANTSHIVEQLLNFDIDLALIEGEVNHSELAIEPWLEDSLHIIAAPSHPYVKKQTITFDDCLKANWILREKGSGTRQTFENAMMGIYPQLHIGLELEHSEAIKHAVQNGMGLGCLSSKVLEKELAEGQLVTLELENVEFVRHFYIVHHKQKFISQQLQAFLQFCQNYR